MLKAIYKLFSSALLKKNLHLVKGLVFLGRKPLVSLDKLDYVRVATLELLAFEIFEKKVEGSVAELGVYKGGFAKYINAVFPANQFYLFDTFSGFDEVDKLSEARHQLNTKNQDFSDTSVGHVLSIMPHREKCVVKKGYFPNSFSGLEKESFCFVSIDADLYEPVSKGLQVFYPALSTNGVIMVHDYNNINYRGCKKAVEEFCRNNNISYVPIPDIGGTVVIRKP